MGHTCLIWQVLWWDIRKIHEPTESLQMDDKTNNGARMGATQTPHMVHSHTVPLPLGAHC